MEGEVRFGAGKDGFDIADGTVAGSVDFGAGANRLALSGHASQSGSVAFGAGADTLSLAGSPQLAADVDFAAGAAIPQTPEGTPLTGKPSKNWGVGARTGDKVDPTHTGTG